MQRFKNNEASWGHQSIYGGQQAQGVDCALCSTLVRSHMGCCIQPWAPQSRKDVLEQIQKKATKLIRGMEQLSERWGCCSACRREALGRPGGSLPVPKGGF